MYLVETAVRYHPYIIISMLSNVLISQKSLWKHENPKLNEFDVWDRELEILEFYDLDSIFLFSLICGFLVGYLW